MRLNGGDTIQLEYNPVANTINIFTNGQNVTNNILSQNDSTAAPAIGGPPYVISFDNVSITVTYNVGLSVTVSVSYLSLTTQFSLPNDFSEQFTGLLGNFDGDPLNDYVIRNGTLLAANSSQAQLYQFGQSCMHLPFAR